MSNVPDSPALRRPEQARSRALVESVLGATKQLIGESGVGPVTMTEIADRAGVGLSAIYRYFPNKAAIVHHIAIDTFREGTALLEDSGSDDASVTSRLRSGVMRYVGLHRDEPWRLPIRNAVLTDPELLALDLEDSRANADLLVEVVSPHSVHDRVTLQRRALLFIESLDSVIRLASIVDAREVDALIDEFVAAAEETLCGVLGGSS